MTIGLDAALKALTAARLGIQTAGQNISNANTPGYARQRVLISADLPFTASGGFQLGTGVKVNGIRHIVDAGIESRLRSQLSFSGAAEMDLTRWTTIEGLVNEPGGLSTQLSEVFDKIAQLQIDPAQPPLRSAVVQSAKSLAVGFNLLADRLNVMRTDVFDETSVMVRQVNDFTAQVAELNEEILGAEVSGSRANDLRDTREQIIKQIADIVEVRVLERSSGSVDVIAGGASIVRGTNQAALRVSKGSDGLTRITVTRSNQELQIQGGRIGALLEHETRSTTEILTRIDDLARNMALEFNRLQTTGITLDGGFQSLVAFSASKDNNRNGVLGDEILSQAGLPFDILAGDLFVTVSNDTTGALERTKLTIDPDNMTLQDLAVALDGLDHLSANVDPSGRLRVRTESGFRFDFSNRLDPQPDSFGSFGGSAPTISTATAGPFDLSASFGGGPATFDVDINGSTTSVSIDASEFVNTATVTTDELVNAINADLGTAARAKNIGGRLVIRSQSSGTSASMTLTDGSGSPLAAAGLTTGTARSGQAQSVTPVVSGKYTGSSNGQLVFVPDADGQIGVTPGLTIGVFDDLGKRVGTLDVSDTYSPGTELDVAEGVKVAFGPGQVSSTFHDVFAVDTIADSDTTDVLVALGLNTLFHGNNAADIAINSDLLSNPKLLATGLTNATGDPDNLARMMRLRSSQLGELAEQSFEDFYSGLVGEVGFQTAAAQTTFATQGQLRDNLQQQRDAVSGVNLDEEAVDMLRFQQAFEAASRYVQTVNEITNTLINLGR